MKWLRDILTGEDNQTIAIGRWMGLVVFALFIVILPAAIYLGIRFGKIATDDAVKLLAALQVYVPSIVLCIGGLIGLTMKSEPKRGDQ